MSACGTAAAPGTAVINGTALIALCADTPSSHNRNTVITLPNGDRAVVDIAKLRDYCLNPFHEDGKHKARVFAAALGLSRADASWLRDRLLEAAASQPTLSMSRIGSELSTW
jgi:hypothetical protein